MYKAGRRWIVAAVAVATVMSTGALSTQIAFAGGNEPTSTGTTQQTGTQQQGATTSTPTSGTNVGTNTPSPAPAPTPAPTAPATVSAATTVAAKAAGVVGTDNSGNVPATATDDHSSSIALGNNGVSVGTWLSAKGTTGQESVSQTPNYADDPTEIIKKGYSAVNPDAKDMTVHFAIANDTDAAITPARVQFFLPFDAATATPKPGTVIIVPSGSFDDFIDQLTTVQNATIKFSFTPYVGPSTSLADAKAEVAQNHGDWSNLAGVQMDFTVLDPGTNLEFLVPVKVTNTTTATKNPSGFAQTQINNFGPNYEYWGGVNSRYFVIDPNAPTTPTNGGGTTPTNPNNGGGTTTPVNPGNGGTTTPDDGNTTVPTTPTLPDTDGHSGQTSDHGTLPDTFGGGESKGQGTTNVVQGQNGIHTSGDQVTLPVTGGKTVVIAKHVAAKPATSQTNPKQATLPQTGDAHDTLLSAMGAALAGIVGVFGLGYKKRDN